MGFDKEGDSVLHHPRPPLYHVHAIAGLHSLHVKLLEPRISPGGLRDTPKLGRLPLAITVSRRSDSLGGDRRGRSLSPRRHGIGDIHFHGHTNGSLALPRRAAPWAQPRAAGLCRALAGDTHTALVYPGLGRTSMLGRKYMGTSG